MVDGLSDPAVAPVERAIAAALDAVEEQHGVRVLFAAESGSRAWGFASPDSDYDVRFVYVHAPDWYLRVFEAHDVIEQMLPGDLDLSGWELRKTLRLFSAGNATLFEWLDSPITYREDAVFAVRLRDLVPSFFRPAKALFHYLGTARSTWRDHLDQPTVRLKKVFYALRPLLACRWIEHARTAPPTAFARLVEAPWVDAAERAMIAQLTAAKARASEADRFELPRDVAEWLVAQMAHNERIGPALGTRGEPAVEALDELLRDLVVRER